MSKGKSGEMKLDWHRNRRTCWPSWYPKSETSKRTLKNKGKQNAR